MTIITKSLKYLQAVAPSELDTVDSYQELQQNTGVLGPPLVDLLHNHSLDALGYIHPRDMGKMEVDSR